jgi:aminoglycoside phosphotransferase (APT) family kinase protein
MRFALVLSLRQDTTRARRNMSGVTHDGMTIEPGDALAALGYRAVSGPLRLTGGWDTLLWRFTADDGRDHVLRCFHLPGAAETARRERIALEACAAAGLAAPRIEAAGEFQGLPVTVQSWCPGTPLLTLIEKRPWMAGRLGRLFGRTQARLHRVAAPRELQATAPRDWAMRVGAEYAHLAENAISQAPSTATLIHLDYHPLNVIVDKRGQAAVIDWEFVAAGDPRADLAVTAATLLAAPLPPGPLRPLLNLMRTIVMRAWERGYCDVAGTMPDYLPLLPWAGAMLLFQTELALGREGVWGTEKDLESLRRLIPVWTNDAARR